MDIQANIKTLRWFYFFIGSVFYAPVAIIYFSQISGSYALGISIFSVEMVSSALFEVPTGVFSDRIGRKKTIVLGAICGVIYTLLYALASNYTILFMGALFAGLARSFYSGNNNALLHDSLLQLKKPETYSEHLGKIGSMEQRALAISGILGGLLASLSLRYAVIVSVLSQLTCLLLSLRLIEPSMRSRTSGNIFNHLKSAIQEFKINKKLRLLTLASSTTYALTESSFQFRSAFYQLVWPLWAIGSAQAIANIGATISFHYSGKVLKKLGAIKSLVIGNLFARIMNIIGTAFPSALSPIIMSSTSIIFGVSVVGKETLLQKEFRQDQRATMGSLNSLAGSILFGIVAVGLGTVADALDPAKALLIIQFFTAATIIFYIMIGHHEKREQKAS